MPLFLHDTDITIRPNLNKKDETTIHKGRLGPKLGFLYEGQMIFSEEVIYKKTLAKIKEGKTSKKIVAGLRGNFVCHHPLLLIGNLLPIKLNMETLSFTCSQPLKKGDLIYFSNQKYYKVVNHIPINWISNF